MAAVSNSVSRSSTIYGKARMSRNMWECYYYLYPFGIGLHCYKDEWYEVTCDQSSKPFLPKIGVEVLNITLEQLRVKSPVFQSCDNTTKVFNDRNSSIVLEGSPFFFSYYDNTFMATGCDNFAYLTGPTGFQKGCVSICSISLNNTERACYGNNCCQSSIPYSLQALDVTIKSVGLNNNKGQCNYAFLVDGNWFYDYVTNRTYMTNTTNHIDMTDTSYVPVLLDWTIRNGSKDYCDNNSPGRRYPGYHSCDCPYGYKGNPYLRGGCQVKECSPGEEYDCIKPKGLLTKAAILGVSLSLGLLFIIFTSWWLYQILKKRRNRKLKEKFFKRNGGMLLQQQISSDEGSVEKTKIFSAEDLEKATDHYNENRILGQGGQGTVYKGMLNDGRIVAVKKAKMVDESQVEQFINEVAILSQINHRNVVKLLGCCLETEVPLLVYEFISNGTLFHHIHDQSEEFFMSWDNRLRIATEVAGALAYLHSAASMPIYHRDIKSTNILLDDKHKAKVSDFGTSRSISVDKTHLTTIVQGTMGYLDPEYFQTSQFTDKSDVYSFGVVLVELLTGEKPISLINSQEWRNLVTHFIQSMKENRLLEILDNRVVDGRKEELEVVANIAKRCLNWNGKKRPTMKEVATELEGLKMSPVYLHTEKNHNVAEIITETSSRWDTGSTSTGYGNSENRVILPLDAQPLLFNTC